MLATVNTGRNTAPRKRPVVRSQDWTQPSSVRQSSRGPRKHAKRTGSSDMAETTANKHATGSPASAPLPRAEPEAVDMSSTRLGRIVTALNKEIEAGQFPGA